MALGTGPPYSPLPPSLISEKPQLNLVTPLIIIDTLATTEPAQSKIDSTLTDQSGHSLSRIWATAVHSMKSTNVCLFLSTHFCLSTSFGTGRPNLSSRSFITIAVTSLVLCDR